MLLCISPLPFLPCLTTEAAILAALQEKGVKADVAAGLSLGEYGAILTVGAMSLELYR